MTQACFAIHEVPNQSPPHRAELFATPRLAGNHPGVYGAVDLSSNDVRGLMERALP